MTTRDAPPPRAPWWVTAFNPVTRPLLARGVPLGPNGLITVRGRRTGEPRSTAVAIIHVDGRRWVWAPWGEVNWVRNLRAAGRATLTVRGREEPVEARELTEQERVAYFRDVLRPFASKVPLGVQMIRYVDGTDLRDPVGAARGRVVFELRPVR